MSDGVDTMCQGIAQRLFGTIENQAKNGTPAYIVTGAWRILHDIAHQDNGATAYHLLEAITLSRIMLMRAARPRFDKHLPMEILVVLEHVTQATHGISLGNYVAAKGKPPVQNPGIHIIRNQNRKLICIAEQRHMEL